MNKLIELHRRFGRFMFVFCMFIGSAAIAAPPNSVNYQGLLTDASGQVINASALSINFRLYTTATGSSMLWQETQSVDVDNGLFSVVLGSVTAFSAGTFDNDELYLGIQVGSDAEMTPRRKLESVVYSLRAADSDQLAGQGASVYDQSAHVTDTANPHALTAASIGALDEGFAPAHIADASAHHTKTTLFSELAGVVNDSQIVDSIARDDELLAHAITSNVHHAPYTDNDALAAVVANSGSGSLLDADLLDGVDSTGFIRTSGGVVNGNLSATGTLGAFELSLTGGDIKFSDGSVQTTAAGKVNHVTVAPVGGDFPTIQAAVDAINPTADGPYVIDVAPGSYTETVRLKSHIHLRGAGRDSTILHPDQGATLEPGPAALILENLDGVTISGFTLDGQFNGVFGIYDVNSSPTVRDNLIKNFRGGGLISGDWPGETAIHSRDSRPQLINNIIDESGVGIYLRNSTARITGNSLSNAGGAGHCGIKIEASRATVTGNSLADSEPVCLRRYTGVNSVAVIQGNTFTDMRNAIEVDGLQSARISDNRITGNGCETAIRNYGEATIIGNYISDCGLIGITNNGDSVVIADNTLFGNGVSGGAQIFNTTGDAVITGNHVDGNAVSYTGIRSVGGRTTISTNSVHGHIDTGIDPGNNDTVTGNQLYNNTVADIAGTPEVSVGNHSLSGASIAERITTPHGFTIDSTGGTVTIGAGASTVTIASDGAISINSNADLSITAAGALNLSGQSVAIDAATNMTLNAGGSLSASGASSVNVQGALINLN